jgi:hypothetical protein
MNNIIIELSAEDRARLAHISVALGRLADVLERSATQEAPTANTPDPIKEKLAEVLAATEAPKNAPTATETQAPSDTLPWEERPTAEETAPAEEAKPTVTTEQIRQKVILLSAAGGQKKAKAREIVSAYAPKISDLPEDKLTEVWDKLTALESEA